LKPGADRLAAWWPCASTGFRTDYANPPEVHHAAREQQQHERPAAAEAVILLAAVLLTAEMTFITNLPRSVLASPPTALLVERCLLFFVELSRKEVYIKTIETQLNSNL
jgi:hypothetical protein